MQTVLTQYSAVFVALLLSAYTSYASEIKCLDSMGATRLIYRQDDGGPIRIPVEVAQCFNAELSGKLEVGDATKVERFFDEQRHLSRLYLLSPGGNVEEAITIGRLIRKRFLPTNARPYREPGRNYPDKPRCGSQGKPPCCVSACTLAYFGGVQWFVGDRLGLHRPTLEDLGDYDYAEAQEHMRRGYSLIKEYLVEMEIDDRVFTSMMETPANEVSVWEIDPQTKGTWDDLERYPKSIHDWLFAKCRRMGDRPRSECMGDELRKERERRADDDMPSNEDEQKFDKMTIADLRTFLRATELVPHTRYLAEKRLERLRLEQDRHTIDEMGVCEVKEYIDARFGDDHKLMAGEGMTMKRAIDRLEALTGDPEPWSMKNRMPVECPQYQSRF